MVEARRLVAKAKRLVRRTLGLEYHPKVQADCPREWLGSSCGGYCVCPEGLNGNSIVYSCGIGEDVSFDLELIAKYGVHVFAFDPTPRSIAWLRSQQLPVNFRFFEYGVAHFDGEATFYPPENPEHISHTVLQRHETADRAIKAPMHRIETIAGMMGHERIDVLKMDVEGAEYPVLDDLVRSRVDVRQLLVEFHDRFPGLGARKTKRAVKRLNRAGFRVFGVRGNVCSFLRA